MPHFFFGGLINWTVCFQNNNENWKIKKLENGEKVEHFYMLHYHHYVFDEKKLLIGDIMRFIQKCPKLPHPPYQLILQKSGKMQYLADQSSKI